MSLELLSTLEAKIQTTLETMEFLELEVEEEKQRNETLQDENTSLKEENTQLQAERQAWNDKVVCLVDLLREDNMKEDDSQDDGDE
ncbi:MAG: cell division protein ZapB [Oleispira sp.]|jgi:cell division protein ZapB